MNAEISSNDCSHIEGDFSQRSICINNTHFRLDRFLIQQNATSGERKHSDNHYIDRNGAFFYVVKTSFEDTN